MASSNNINWFGFDPIKATDRAIVNYSSYIGEIQNKYYSVFRSIWIHPSSLIHFTTGSIGDTYRYGWGDIEEYDVIPTGNHLVNYPANAVNKYFVNLLELRHHLGHFKNNFNWVHASGRNNKNEDGSSYFGPSIYPIWVQNEDPYYYEEEGLFQPPYKDFVNFLREIPNVVKNFNCTGINYDLPGDITAWHIPENLGENPSQSWEEEGLFYTTPDTEGNMSGLAKLKVSTYGSGANWADVLIDEEPPIDPPEPQYTPGNISTSNPVLNQSQDSVSLTTPGISISTNREEDLEYWTSGGEIENIHRFSRKVDHPPIGGGSGESAVYPKLPPEKGFILAPDVTVEISLNMDGLSPNNNYWYVELYGYQDSAAVYPEFYEGHSLLEYTDEFNLLHPGLTTTILCRYQYNLTGTEDLVLGLYGYREYNERILSSRVFRPVQDFPYINGYSCTGIKVVCGANRDGTGENPVSVSQTISIGQLKVKFDTGT